MGAWTPRGPPEPIPALGRVRQCDARTGERGDATEHRPGIDRYVSRVPFRRTQPNWILLGNELSAGFTVASLSLAPVEPEDIRWLGVQFARARGLHTHV